MGQYLTEDSSWEALMPKLQQLDKRLQGLGLPTPTAVYLDNTMSSEDSIRSALSGLEHVKEDHFHAVRRFTSQMPDDLPEKREWLVCLQFPVICMLIFARPSIHFTDPHNRFKFFSVLYPTHVCALQQMPAIMHSSR